MKGQSINYPYRDNAVVDPHTGGIGKWRVYWLAGGGTYSKGGYSQ
jgi:hypothetical protein